MENLTQRQVFGSSRGFEDKNTHCRSVQERASVLRTAARKRCAQRTRLQGFSPKKRCPPVCNRLRTFLSIARELSRAKVAIPLQEIDDDEKFTRTVFNGSLGSRHGW